MKMFMHEAKDKFTTNLLRLNVFFERMADIVQILYKYFICIARISSHSVE